VIPYAGPRTTGKTDATPRRMRESSARSGSVETLGTPVPEAVGTTGSARITHRSNRTYLMIIGRRQKPDDGLRTGLAGWNLPPASRTGSAFAGWGPYLGRSMESSRLGCNRGSPFGRGFAP
jgi:hypothetical protein